MPLSPQQIRSAGRSAARRAAPAGRAAASVPLEAGRTFASKQPFQLAAALSYYTLLSIAPLLLLVTGLAGMLLGQQAVQQQLIVEMRALVGEEGASLLETVIDNAASPGRGLTSMVIGGGLMILGATTVFAQLQNALNSLWGLKAVPQNALIGFLRARLVSFGVVLSLGFLLLMSLVLSAALAAFEQYLDTLLPGTPVLWQILNALVSLLLVTLLVATLFKFVPDAVIAWRHTWMGAFFTALMLSVGKFLIGIYLGHASVGSAYGAAGSAVVLMVWVYYAALILFFGAELTRVIAERRGAPVRPNRFAEAVAAPA